jgi:hypothetical protein
MLQEASAAVWSNESRLISVMWEGGPGLNQGHTPGAVGCVSLHDMAWLDEIMACIAVHLVNMPSQMMNRAH